MRTVDIRKIRTGKVKNLTKVDLSERMLDFVNIPGANFTQANLYRVDFMGANLPEAIFFGANLCQARFISARLNNSNLSVANLREANLASADLSGSTLIGSDLCCAYLYQADLSDTDLQGTNLRRTRLNGANLTGAKLPAPQMLLLAEWGEVSDNLCQKLMAYDAQSHSDPNLFNIWKKTGMCPYADSLFDRAANFNQRKSLWSSKLLTLKIKPHKLVLELFKEKGIKY